MSELRFRRIADTAPAILWVTDPAGMCTYLSRQWYEFTGQRPEDGLGMGWTEAVHPGDREVSAAIFLAANQRREPFRLDYRLRRVDGEYRWAVDAGQPHYSPEGEFLGYVGSVLDITERKLAEDALRLSEERLRQVTATSPAVLYTLRMDGQTVQSRWVSENLEQTLGYEVAEALAPGWWRDNVHPEDRDGAIAAMDELLRTGALTHEYRFRHRDGSYRWIRDQLRVVPGSDGTEVVGSWMDATDFRQLENQFHQVQKLEAVGRLAGGIAHDFNNVLTAVKGFAELMLEDLDAADPLRADAAEIVSVSESGSALVRQLMAFSRQQVIQPEVFDLNDVVTGVQRMLLRLIGDDVTLVTDLDPAAGAVRADRGQLEQVLLNLAINSRDAMPDGGHLTISTRATEVAAAGAPAWTPEPGPAVVLTVADTGCGMGEDVLEKIFEPFFTTKEKEKGTGLGLSIVYGIVKQSAGHIEVESELGRGTTFRIHLPRLEAVGPPAEQPPEPTAPVNSETVLLVEDQANVRTFVRRVLERRGYRVLEAANGVEALTLCKQQDEPIHLLLTDVVMPRMSGRELAQRLRALRPGLPVLFMSGYAESEIAHRGVLDPDTQFIEKPFSPDALARKARHVLDG